MTGQEAVLTNAQLLWPFMHVISFICLVELEATKEGCKIAGACAACLL